LKHGDEDGTSIKTLMSDTAGENEAEQVHYLENGAVFIACAGVVKDVLNSSNGVIGSPHILTDGVWAWPKDLAYYVQKYHVKLPDEFIQHMKNNRWNPPAEMEIDMSGLEM
jgi:hypothetical protein